MGSQHKRMKERQNYYRDQSKRTDSRSKRRQVFYTTQFETAARELRAMVEIKPRDTRHHQATAEPADACEDGEH
jgi:hypothetical protein